jgi:hypothetical protein
MFKAGLRPDGMYRCVDTVGHLPSYSREGVGIRHRAADTFNAVMAWLLLTETILNLLNV